MTSLSEKEAEDVVKYIARYQKGNRYKSRW